MNWEAVCIPKIPWGSLGVLNTILFARVPRLRWPYLEWKDSFKIWGGLGNASTKLDMEILYAATRIAMGNGEKTHFGRPLGSMAGSRKT
jgi:hypothetical protein